MNFTYIKQTNKTIKSGKPEQIFLYWREFVRNQKNIIIVFIRKRFHKKEFVVDLRKKTADRWHISCQQTADSNSKLV